MKLHFALFFSQWLTYLQKIVKIVVAAIKYQLEDCTFMFTLYYSEPSEQKFQRNCEI